MPTGPAPLPLTLVYTVQASDLDEGLTGIARRLHGDSAPWPELYAVNRGVVGEDPARLQAGQRLIALP